MAMDRKQKGILVLTIGVLLFLGWQVYELLRDDFSSQVVHNSNPMSSNPTPTNAPLKPMEPVHIPPAAQTPKAENLPPELIKSMNFPSRTQYLQLANQYEMAKMQRQLLEEEVAIANAKMQIARTNTGEATDLSPTLSVTTNAPELGLALVYVAQQEGHWTATLVQNGQYQIVVVGARLPPDIQVLGIDDEGVLIHQPAGRKKITFNGIISVDGPAPATQEVLH